MPQASLLDLFHLPLPRPLDEVGIHQLINSQIKTTAHERRQATIREREGVRYDAALLHGVPLGNLPRGAISVSTDWKTYPLHSRTANTSTNRPIQPNWNRLEKSQTLSSLSDAEIVATGLLGRRLWLDASMQGLTTVLTGMFDG